MSSLYNLARMTTSTTGAGTVTLNEAVRSFLSFDRAGVKNNEIITYGIDDGANREMGRGTYNATAKTLTRDVILKSTNDDDPINLSGKAEVAITAAAEDLAAEAGPRGPKGPPGEPSEPPHDDDIAYLRRNGVWIPMTVVRGTIDAPWISIVAAATFVDGPTIDVGNVGTWLVSGVITFVANTARHFFAKLWDGTNVISDGQTTTFSVNWPSCTPLSGVITDPAGPLRISFACHDANGYLTTGRYTFPTYPFLADSNFNYITAVRIG